MEKAVEKKAETVAKKKYDTRFQTYPDGTSMITRKNLSSIVDKTDKAVLWLAANKFKPEEIEIIGEKPSIWNEAFHIEETIAETK